MIRFIDDHKDRRSGELRWGIEPICAQVRIAPSTYHAAKQRPPSPRAMRDAELRPEVLRVWEQNLAVYGADNVWDKANKDGMGDRLAGEATWVIEPPKRTASSGRV